MSRTALTKIRQFLGLGVLGSIGFSGICLYKNDEKFYRSILMPAIHKIFDGEAAHNLAIKLIKQKCLPKSPNDSEQILKSKVFGLEFNNPVGLAAGFDKSGEAIEGLNDIGFGFIEIGSVTPLPQVGNDKPRVFRLPEDQGVINRYGFNNDGHEVVFERIKQSNRHGIVLGVNLGKNKTSIASKDYALGIEKFASVCDYLVINVSSPNTPGLRSLQAKEELSKLIDVVVKTRTIIKSETPILLKISPDLSSEGFQDIASVISSSNIDGIIVSNTTLSRPHDLKSKNHNETGGLSGKPLCEISTKAIREMYKLTNGKIPIIGVGGIYDGNDAYEKLAAGASLIQIYSSLIYLGPPVVQKINNELATLMKKKGFQNLSELIGSENPLKK